MQHASCRSPCFCCVFQERPARLPTLFFCDGSVAVLAVAFAASSPLGLRGSITQISHDPWVAGFSVRDSRSMIRIVLHLTCKHLASILSNVHNSVSLYHCDDFALRLQESRIVQPTQDGGARRRASMLEQAQGKHRVRTSTHRARWSHFHP